MFLLVSSRAGYLASLGLTWHLGEPHAVASPEQIGPWEAAEKSVAKIFLRDRRPYCSLDLLFWSLIISRGMLKIAKVSFYSNT